MDTPAIVGQAPQTFDLYILGAGVSFPEHLTIQSIDVLGSCSKICTNLPEPKLDGLPSDIRGKCTSLWPLYQEGRLRKDNYRDVIRAVLSAAERERPIAWLTHGHPLLFDSVSASLLEASAANRWNVCTLPAISCIDTLLVDVGYDPAGGLFIYDATSLVVRNVPLLPSVASILLQPAAFGINYAMLSLEHSGPDLTPLRDHLLRFHSASHSCAFIRSSAVAGGRSQITWIKLLDLMNVSFPQIAGSSLFVPGTQALNYKACASDQL